MKNVPEPLKIEEIDLDKCEPISTTAKFKEYEQKRSIALQITPQQLKNISPGDRDDYVFQYLTPDEIWQLKDALTRDSNKVPPIANLDTINKSVDEESTTVNDFTDHEKKRREFGNLTEDDFRRKSLAEIESYYQFLTPEEILEQNEKLGCLASIAENKNNA